MTSQKIGCCVFWHIANSVLNKGKSAVPPLFNIPEVLSSASDKAKLPKTFLRTLLGLLDQQHIFSQLYLIEFLGLLTDLGLLQLWHLISPRLLTGFGMLVYVTNLSLMEFQARYLALLLLFSAINSFKWFWMENLHKNIQLMQDFLKGPFLVLHFSCCILMTFLKMLSEILLSMLIILLFILTVIRHLICGNNLNWLLNLNLIYETLWTGVRSGLLISMLGKLSWFCLTSLITMGLLM